MNSRHLEKKVSKSRLHLLNISLGAVGSSVSSEMKTSLSSETDLTLPEGKDHQIEEDPIGDTDSESLSKDQVRSDGNMKAEARADDVQSPKEEFNDDRESTPDDTEGGQQSEMVDKKEAERKAMLGVRLFLLVVPPNSVQERIEDAKRALEELRESIDSAEKEGDLDVAVR